MGEDEAARYSSEDSDTETVVPDAEDWDGFIFSQQAPEEDTIPTTRYRNPAPIDFDADSDTEADSGSSSPAPSSPVLTGRSLRRMRSLSPESGTSPPRKRTKVRQPQFVGPSSFFRLPDDIRSRIYALAAPPRARVVELHDYNTQDYTPKLQYYPPLPSLFSVCQESRQALMAEEGGQIVHFTGDPSFGDGAVRGGAMYINFTKDTIFLGTRFTATRDTTETFRMKILGQILKPHYLAKIERLLVTYSGKDSYVNIGMSFFPFTHLKIFYIGMQDEFSKKGDEKDEELLEDSGDTNMVDVAQVIESFVEEHEGMETEDDDQSDEQAHAQLVARAARQFVEVKSHLDI